MELPSINVYHVRLITKEFLIILHMIVLVTSDTEML